jgi:hypothetical protein
LEAVGHFHKKVTPIEHCESLFLFIPVGRWGRGQSFPAVSLQADSAVY